MNDKMLVPPVTDTLKLGLVLQVPSSRALMMFRSTEPLAW